MKKLLITSVLAIVARVSAFAWGAAFIAEPTSGRVVRMVNGYETVQAAKDMVEEVCSTKYRGSPCHIIGAPQEGKMVAVYVGDTAYDGGANSDAKAALAEALSKCSKKTRNCVVQGIFYMGKPMYAASAFSKKNGYYVSTNHLSNNVAEKSVMALCAKGSSAKDCSLEQAMSTRKQVTYASASSLSGTNNLSFAKSVAEAQSNAINGCEKTSGQKCTLGIKEAWNDGIAPISKPNKDVVWKTSIDMALHENHAKTAKLKAEMAAAAASLPPEVRQSEPVKMDMGPCMVTKAPLGGDIKTPGCFD